jgi:hypothetical protein
MKTKALLLICLLLGMGTSGASAQEWTKAQKEIWQVVENSWMTWTTLDIEGFAAILHEKYQGWNNNTPLPITKEMYKKELQEMQKTLKFGFYEINPARIVVTENAAVVDYYFVYETTDTQVEKAEKHENSGKNVEFYTKEGGKWLLIGDLTLIDK